MGTDAIWGHAVWPWWPQDRGRAGPGSQWVTTGLGALARLALGGVWAAACSCTASCLQGALGACLWRETW